MQRHVREEKEEEKMEEPSLFDEAEHCYKRRNMFVCIHASCLTFVPPPTTPPTIHRPISHHHHYLLHYTSLSPFF